MFIGGFMAEGLFFSEDLIRKCLADETALKKAK